MTQAQTQEKRDDLQEVELSFKRFILEETSGFVCEPMADLYRINTLAKMLDRYDQLRAHGATQAACIQHVKREFKDIDELMRAEGFEELEGGRRNVSRWPVMTEDEAARYIKESDAYLHKQSLGVGLCAACCLPLLLMNGLSELFMGYADDAAAMLGLVGMFGMIGMGVYSIVTAKKPKGEKKVKKGRFVLPARLRRKIEEMKEDVDDRARRRTGKGIAMIVTCVLPIFAGAALDSFWYSDAGAMIGFAGMFAMIGAGVYELVMADGEKKTIKKLLSDKRK